MHLKKLDLNSLVVFHAVWTHRSVTRAAEELHVAQPTISSCLKRLRAFFNDSLFTWEGLQMNPTAKAQELAPQIAEIVNRADDLVERNGYDPLLVERDFVIASADYVFALLGASLNSQLDLQAPRLRVSFIDSTAEQFPRLKSFQSAGLYIFPEDVAPAPGLRYEPLLEDSYVVVQWTKASRRPATLDTTTFLDWPKVMFSVDHRRLANHEMQGFIAAGTPIHTSMLVPNYLAIPSMIVGTDRIAVMPRNVLKVSNLKDVLAPVAFDMPLPALSLGMYWDPVHERDPVHMWLRQAVRQAVITTPKA